MRSLNLDGSLSVALCEALIMIILGIDCFPQKLFSVILVIVLIHLLLVIVLLDDLFLFLLDYYR